jgi:hypothetical protein
MEFEQRFYASMRRYLKDELGVQSLLLGTSDHNHSISGYPLLHSVSQLDIVDGTRTGSIRGISPTRTPAAPPASRSPTRPW